MSPLRLHEDPSLFREAVNFTAAETGFSSRLVEKDYFCSVLLLWMSRRLVWRHCDSSSTRS